MLAQPVALARLPCRHVLRSELGRLARFLLLRGRSWRAGYDPTNEFAGAQERKRETCAGVLPVQNVCSGIVLSQAHIEQDVVLGGDGARSQC